MVDNPFFPGYIPKKEDDTPINPLFPGYSEGQRPYVPPKDLNPLGSVQFDADEWMAQVDQMSADISNMPRWVLEKYVGDFKENLKASYRTEAVPVEQMDDYDQDVFPGVASVSMTLDPTEWKDPGKVLETTAKAWIKSGTGLRFQKTGWGLEAMPIDLEDFENNVKTKMWRVAMGIHDETRTDYLANLGGEAIAGATRSRGGDTSPGNNRLFDFSESDYTVGNNYTYEALAKNAVDMQRYMLAPQKRDSQSDTLMSSHISAVKNELKGSFEYQPTDSTNPIKDNRLNIWTKLYEEGSQDQKDFKKAVEILDKKADLVSDINITSEGLGRLKQTLQSRVSNHPDQVKRGDIDFDINRPGWKTSFEGTLDKTQSDIQKKLGMVAGEESILDQVEKLKAIDITHGTKTEAIAKKYIKSLEETLNNIEQFKAGKLTERQLYNLISQRTDELGGGNVLHPSIYREMLRMTEGDLIGAGKIASVDPRTQIGFWTVDLERRTKQIDPNTGKPLIEGLFAEKGQQYKGYWGHQAQMVVSRLELDRGSYAIEELYDAVTGGKFMERYIWNPMAKKLVGFTPGELVTQGFERVGYFGLKIDDDYVSYKLRNSETFNKIFKHKFEIKLGDEKFKIYGSKDLRAIGTLSKYQLSTDKFTDDELINLMTGKLKVVDFKTPQKVFRKGKAVTVKVTGATQKVYRKGKVVTVPITGATGQLEINMALKSKFPNWWTSGKNDIDKANGLLAAKGLQNQLDDLNNWLKVNAAKLGIKDLNNLTEDDKKKLKELFKALDKENRFPGSLSITKEYAGLTQVVAQKLNQLQTKMFGSPVFQRLIMPVLQLKTVISETLSKAVSNLLSEFLTKALHVGTGGATVILDRVIKFLIDKVAQVVRFITRKLVENVQNFVVALAEGDISKAMAQADKELIRIIKFTLYITSIPFLIIWIFLYGVFGTTLSTISPIDPTKDNSGYAGAMGSGFPMGENALIKLEKSVTVNGVDVNPTTPYSNTELASGLHVVYTLTITPKVDLEENIVFTDIMTGINKDGTYSIRRWDNRTAGPYVAGVPYVITLEDVFLQDSGYADSLIKNELSVVTPAMDNYAEETVSVIRMFRIGESPVDLACFQITGPNLDGPLQDATINALIETGAMTGNFLSKLCTHYPTNNPLQIEFNWGVNECGWAGDVGKIVFGGSCSEHYYLGALNYLLPHELAHKYRGYYDNESVGMAQAAADDGGTLPTYDLNCGNRNIGPSEGFSEVIGNIVKVNSGLGGNCDISGWDGDNYDLFWSHFPHQYEYAQTVVFN